MDFGKLSCAVFGPVPSRRLGRSLGINNILPKHCTYSCIYCQLGRNKKITADRRFFYDPVALAAQVERKIEEAEKKQEHIDYLSFVPDGEPTLDINIGEIIRILKRTGIKIAVITNSSLLFDEKVREDIIEADLVSMKIDCFKELIWHAVNRPHRFFNIKEISNGMVEFAKVFEGRLITESMIIDKFNTGRDELTEMAAFIKNLKPDISYISVPTRPPAEKWAIPPDEGRLSEVYEILRGAVGRVECLTGDEGDDFAQTGNLREDILGITSVHPMRDDSMRDFLIKAGAEWSVIEQLIRENKLVETEYNNKKYYVRKFNI
ncbi:MAG: radical SAM protein [Spirochaetes bacterium]|nr:radical SAM protein [Spirochaetota bacterium]